jgi:hypothetical protein
MKTNPFVPCRAFWLGLLLLACGSLPLHSAQFGLFTYQVIGNTVTITACAQSASGLVEIPAMIEGKPVTRIGDRAFQTREGVTSVTIPPGVTRIGSDAFNSCYRLATVSIPSSVTDIGKGAFGYTSLRSVNLPPGLTRIDDDMFTACTLLESITIPPSVTSIGNNAFQACLLLSTVSIPSSVTRIGKYAFWECSSLSRVNLLPGLTTIDEAAFIGLLGLTNLTIPSTVNRIGDSAFAGCSSLRTVSFPPSNPSIGSFVFSGCGFGTFNIPPGLTKIGQGMFLSCFELTNITIPTSVTHIGEHAFDYCSKLSRVIIPASVTSLGGPGEHQPAFSGCPAMTNVVFLGNAPSTVRTEFERSAAGFSIHFLGSRTGFTSPIWRGHPATRIDEATYPAAAWLLTHGLWYDTGLGTDPDGDGVDLLAAYALNLDPTLPQRPQMPAPVLTDATLSLDFQATTPGITYRAETSTDLTGWTTEGVARSAPGPNGRSTASIPRDIASRFLRLTFQLSP